MCRRFCQARYAADLPKEGKYDYTGDSACIAVAKDGAKRLTRFWYDADKKFQPETVGGTGKYDGMVTTGTVQTVKEAESIKPGNHTVEYCNRNIGTYNLNWNANNLLTCLRNFERFIPGKWLWVEGTTGTDGAA